MTMLDALLLWYLCSTLGWILAAFFKYRRRRLVDYLWCLVWPVGLVVHR